MKRTLFLLAMLMSLTSSLHAETIVSIVDKDSLMWKGQVINITDSTISFWVSNKVSQFKQKYGETKYIFQPDELLYFVINNNYYAIMNGKFERVSKKQIIPIAHTDEDVRPTNDGLHLETIQHTTAYKVGKELKSSGNVLIGLGVPIMSAGLVTLIAGHTVPHSQCLEASCYLLPVGAALTLVGIPLNVKGKKIMEMEIKTTGNAMGMALHF